MKRIVLIFMLICFLLPNVLMVEADNWGDPGVFYIYTMGPSIHPIDIEREDWEEIERKWPNSILFDLTLFSGSLIKGKDFEIAEYYEESEDVIAIKFYIWKINEQTNLSKVTLTVTSPDDTVYCNIILLENITENETVVIKSLDNNSFSFDMTGLWRFRLDFESNVTSLIWRHVGNHIFQTFKPTMYYNRILDPLIFLDFYSEEIPVITLSDALQVSNINTIAKQTDYLNKSAAAQEESAESQQNLATGTMILAIATLTTAIIIIITFVVRLSSQKKAMKEQNEIIKGSFEKLTTEIKQTNNRLMEIISKQKEEK